MYHWTGIARDGLRDIGPKLWRPAPRIVRDLKGLSPVLARSGPLELRLALTKRDIRKAQRLRFKVFYEEGTAIPAARNALSRRDKCAHDRVCDHLLVVDTAADGRGTPQDKVVGTYRLMRSDMALNGTGFYSGTEFAIEPLLERHRSKQFLELGRSCVHQRYRSKRVIDLLWRGIGLYAAYHGSDVLIGCASLPGVEIEKVAVQLSFAYHYAAAEPSWQVAAAPGRGVRMNWLDRDTIEPRRALASLPPLMKAYVRAGGTFGSDAVQDLQFGTTDLFTVLPFTAADPRYLAHFGTEILDAISPAAVC